jgi:putative ABC transport system permease protein
MTDPRTGKSMSLTVIGVLDFGAGSFSSASLYTGQSTLRAAHEPLPPSSTYYFRVAPGQDVHQTALALGSAFLPYGLEVHEAQADYNKFQSVQIGFNSLLEGFMALGLVVGIAALGVIATRAVVERRQQIGMMRAIGFKRRTVQIAFLLESSFVAILGTLVGGVLGILLGWQVEAYFAKTQPGLHLVIPWPEVALIVIGAYLASLLTTYFPSWQASRIYPAEALRYE